MAVYPGAPPPSFTQVGSVKDGDGQVIGMEIFDEVDLGGIEFGFIYCDWAKYWYEPKFWGKFPYIGEEVAEFISNHEIISGIVFEYVIIDPLEDTDLKLHKIIMKKEKTIIENLKNLDLLIGRDFTFAGFPLKLKGVEGSPIRSAAIINK